MKIIVINGRGGVGKDEFIKWCREANNDIYSVSSVDYVKEIARLIGWNGEKDVKGRKFLSDLKDAFKCIPALYAFTRRFPNSAISYTHEIVYVGETGDLSNRFDKHHKQDCIIRNKANCVCIHSFHGTQTERLAAEADILNAFDLPCNVMDN